MSISCFSKSYSQGLGYLEYTRARDTLERKSPSTTPFAFYNGYDLYACLDFGDSALHIKINVLKRLGLIDISLSF